MAPEKMPRGTPTRAERLPLDIAAVDAAWLTRMLQPQYPGVRVESLAIIDLIQGHTTKAMVSLEYNRAGLNAGLPTSACLKANWSGTPLSSTVCANEARFYKLLNSQLPLPTPRCFLADWDDDEVGQQGLIMLEDMHQRLGQFDTSAHPISLDAMANALEGLAALHGSSWMHYELDRQPWLQTAMAPETAWDDYWSMMEGHYAKHNAIPERLAIFPRLMHENPERLRAAWQQLRAYDQASSAPRCLVHGDAHLGNSYGLPDGERLWFDWQIVRRGRPWRDISYFLIGSITVEDRRGSERDLLRHYLDKLTAFDVVIDFDQAFADYARWIVWGLVAWQSNINPKEETMPPLERFCRAADDLRIEQYFTF
jgi:aminoglycoside phosphotransferase (APT) family kinase protein